MFTFSLQCTFLYAFSTSVLNALTLSLSLSLSLSLFFSLFFSVPLKSPCVAKHAKHKAYPLPTVAFEAFVAFEGGSWMLQIRW